MLDIHAGAPLTEQETAYADRLTALAESFGVDPSDLDEPVHDAASHHASNAYNTGDGPDDPEEAYEALHDEAGHGAADINNGGLSAQIPYLIAHFGADNTERCIREAADTSRARTA